MATTWFTYNGKGLTSRAGYALGSGDPYNPLNLPPYTIRVQYSENHSPGPGIGDSRTLVDAEHNIWDIAKYSPDWSYLFAGEWVEAVLGANTTGVSNMESLFTNTFLKETVLFDTRSVTNMMGMFQDTKITTCPIYPTDAVTNMELMFGGCYELREVPLLPTSSVTSVVQMFLADGKVETGSLAFYQQLSTQAVPPVYHEQCFLACGYETVSGRADLAQIPESWGGLLRT